MQQPARIATVHKITSWKSPLNLEEAGENGLLDFPQERERHGGWHQRQE
jgi:hypothetical protein